MVGSVYESVTGFFLLLSWLVFWRFFWFNKRQKKIPVFWDPVFGIFSAIAVGLILLLAALLFFETDPLLTPHGWQWLEVVLGWFALIGGQTLMISSRKALSGLGDVDLVFRLSKHQVVDGPYRYLRHPMYVGLLAALVGASAVLLNVHGFELCVIIALVLLMRAWIESGS